MSRRSEQSSVFNHAPITSIERDNAAFDEVKLHAELGALRIENAKLRASKEELLTQLFDCLQALIRSERRQRT